MRQAVMLALLFVAVIFAQHFAWRQQSEVAVAHEVIAANPALYFASVGPKAGTVIVAHGFSANKTMMRPPARVVDGPGVWSGV